PHDDDLNLIDMGGRIYSPSTRQFLTPDPLGRLGASPYSYVRNNPLNWIDPTGFTEEEPEGTWYSGFSNLFSSAPIVAVDVSPALVDHLMAVAAAMDFPNGNDAPNSSGCPDGTGTAPRPCAAPGEAGCSPVIGPPTVEEDTYYTQSQYRIMGIATAFMGGGTTGVLDFFAAEANSRPDAGVDPPELPIAGPPDSPDAEWEGGLLADPAMRAATGMAIDVMVGAAVGHGIAAGGPARGGGFASRGTGAFLESAEGGAGLGKLAGRSIKVSEKGLTIVEQHLARPQFAGAPQNAAMIVRLRSSLLGGSRVTGADASFYLHEISEATMMGRGLSYDAAHAAALGKYGVSPFSVYHPEVIQMYPGFFNSNWAAFWRIP
ncbi:MAG: RHS repeat-associated core domain-containing protein, partial [Polyangiaceae bacterium]|nr:RHS repeat-associated core domain-containing protein [Polyangiaceae bacterium]